VFGEKVKIKRRMFVIITLGLSVLTNKDEEDKLAAAVKEAAGNIKKVIICKSARGAFAIAIIKYIN
jgi:isopentenyl phosphate kinase